MKINLPFLQSLNEQERIVADSIINRLQMALAYYYDKCLENPKLNELIDFGHECKCKGE